MDRRRVPAAVRRRVAELVALQLRIEAGEGEAALRDRVEGALVAARGDVDRAADALGWTAAAIETLLVDHPHWWPREELGPRG